MVHSENLQLCTFWGSASEAEVPLHYSFRFCHTVYIVALHPGLRSDLLNINTKLLQTPWQNRKKTRIPDKVGTTSLHTLSNKEEPKTSQTGFYKTHIGEKIRGVTDTTRDQD